MERTLISTIILATLAACGGGNAVSPGSESVPAHDREAAANDQAARVHDANYDPNARLVEDCQDAPNAGPADAPCWASVVNPTDTEREQAAEHRRLAAEHRAASRELRDAEAAACANVSESDRDLCPLMHREDILGVTPLQEAGPHGAQQLVGAVVKFRDVRGLDLAWLERVLNCHSAQAAAYGEGYENPVCPLVLRGVTVSVTQAGDGFLVSLRATDPTEAATVLERAQAIIAPTAT